MPKPTKLQLQIAHRFMERRTRLQMTQERFAKQCGVTTEDVDDWETGDAFIPEIAYFQLGLLEMEFVAFGFFHMLTSAKKDEEKCPIEFL